MILFRQIGSFFKSYLPALGLLAIVYAALILFVYDPSEHRSLLDLLPLIVVFIFPALFITTILYVFIVSLLFAFDFDVGRYYNSWKERNAVCSHGVKGGLAKRLCDLCKKEEEEKQKNIAEQRSKQIDQARQIRLKEDIKRKATELKNAETERLQKLMIRANEQALFSLSPRDFEEAIADLYKKLDYSVKLTPYTDDHGIDIIAYKNMIHYVIQCKRYKNNKVGRPELQQFYGAMMHQKADQGIFITTSSFTEQAKGFSRGKNIELVDFDELTLMMRNSLPNIDHECIKVMCLECGNIVEFGINEGTNEKHCFLGHAVINNITEHELSSQTISDKVYCDICGKEMRLINGRYGKFWGCTGYPKCKHNKPYRTTRSK
jgi:HJR/Mrr/RecB family endonuclease